MVPQRSDASDEREKDIETIIPMIFANQMASFLLYNNEYVPIKWDKVVLPFNNGGWLSRMDIETVQ